MTGAGAARAADTAGRLAGSTMEGEAEGSLGAEEK